MYRHSKLATTLAALALALGVTSVTQAAQSEPHLVEKPRHTYRLSIAAERAQLQRVVTREKRAEEREQQFGLVGGVAPGTLEAIAACESGGDPAAVNPAGYYGKYQFDLGTWASVGGSGNPAEASEAEQDYRASILYSRAGSSPWPVCGV